MTDALHILLAVLGLGLVLWGIQGLDKELK